MFTTLVKRKNFWYVQVRSPEGVLMERGFSLKREALQLQDDLRRLTIAEVAASFAEHYFSKVKGAKNLGIHWLRH